MPSLRLELLNEIEKHGYLRRDQLDAIVRKRGNVSSNGERRLRELVKMGQVIPKKNEKKFIEGYFAAFPKPQQVPTTSAQTKVEIQFKPLHGAML